MSVVVVDPSELEAMIERAVRRALAQRPPEDVWLDTAGAAEVLGVHPRTVTAMAKRGEIPSTRLGKLYRFRRADLTAYLAGDLDDA